MRFLVNKKAKSQTTDSKKTIVSKQDRSVVGKNTTYPRIGESMAECPPEVEFGRKGGYRCKPSVAEGGSGPTDP